MHVYLVLKRPSKASAFPWSDPSGGGVLHLVSEHMVYEKGQKVFKTFEKLFSKPSIKYFPKKSLVILKGYSPKAISTIL